MAPNVSEISDLIERLSSDDGRERAAARRRLVEFGIFAVAPLVERLRTGDDFARFESAKALQALALPAAAPALAEALLDMDGDIRWVAAEALVALGEAGLRAALQLLAVREGSGRLYDGTGHVLRACRDTRIETIARPVLATLAGTAPEETVPAAAGAALRELQQAGA
jgi:HEAT repeat protein